MSLLFARTPADISTRLRARDPIEFKHPVTGETALLLAVQRCDLEAAQILIRHSADSLVSGAVREALSQQDLTMMCILLSSLGLLDQTYYLLLLLYRILVTWLAFRIRGWPVYALPGEIEVAHSMPACGPNTILFCFPDEYGHLRQGIALAKRALQKGFAVDFLCPEGARTKLPAGVRWIPMAGCVQRNTDVRVPLITRAARAHEIVMETLAYVQTDAPTKSENWATYLSAATYLQHRAADYACAVLEHVFCARELAHFALQQNTPVLSLDVTGFAVRPHYTCAAPPSCLARPGLVFRRWLGGKCRQRQDAAWMRAMRAARLFPRVPRRRAPTEAVALVALHTQPAALMPLGFHLARQHAIGPMLDDLSADAAPDHAALQWIEAQEKPVIYMAFGSQLTLLNEVPPAPTAFQRAPHMHCKMRAITRVPPTVPGAAGRRTSC